MVKSYIKKPVRIEAIQYTGVNLREVINFTGLHDSVLHMTWEEYSKLVDAQGLKIFTLEGTMLANVNDYIIRGVNGEFYPCKPDIFAKSYMESNDG